MGPHGGGGGRPPPPPPPLVRRILPKQNPAPAEAESPQGGGGPADRQPAERPAGSSCKAPGLPRPRRGLVAGDGQGGH
jgi:hypothetical protein